jgi:hypothetical protein
VETDFRTGDAPWWPETILFITGIIRFHVRIQLSIISYNPNRRTKNFNF